MSCAHPYPPSTSAAPDPSPTVLALFPAEQSIARPSSAVEFLHQLLVGTRIVIPVVNTEGCWERGRKGGKVGDKKRAVSRRAGVNNKLRSILRPPTRWSRIDIAYEVPGVCITYVVRILYRVPLRDLD